jgi:hypothetical protein
VLIAPDEIRHLREGPRVGEQPGDAGLIAFEVEVPTGTAVDALNRCRDVLSPIILHQHGDWPGLDSWRTLLPVWFVLACGAEESPEDAERWLSWWRQLPAAEQQQAADERPWSLADWLYWMQPENREWFWWDARVSDRGGLRVYVEVAAWPAPVGSLQWLFRAVGALGIDVADDASN